ncbi:MAG: ferrous iron transporter B [Bifidobacteriaceae bacterium]|jgi:ferrous iron transport protein B|nr:ferrous iron transporter B [Bifidobacteriaceae bacterium]
MARVALVGNPNVGKSTLFNLLTGAWQVTMNAPRTTVSLEIGQWQPGGLGVELMDLPGTYSLIAQSPDEEVTRDVVAGLGTGILARRPDLAMVVLDATALSSSLYLLAQVRALGMPAVAVVTMADVAGARGLAVDTATLAAAIDAPVVTVNPRGGQGIEVLAETVADYLMEHRQAPDGGNAEALVDQADQFFDWVASILDRAEIHHAETVTASDKADRLLLRPWVGVPLFLAVLWALFQLTTVVAAPLQDGFEWVITGPVADAAVWLLGRAGWAGGWLESLVVDGVLAGAGVVVSFLPLMAIMFAAIALLEDSGYMARVAFVADRLMRTIALDGRAVLPLVIGFGCNLPALAATRTLPSARQRLAVGLLIPYSSCTARLVVYLFVAQVFFPRYAGTVVFAMYGVSVAVMVAAGLILRGTTVRGAGSEPLVLALPAYQVPRVRALTRSILLRCRGFAIHAGGLIVALTMAVWLLMSVPVTSGYALGEDIPARDSLFGATAQALAPVFTPAGFGDWHASAALITGFVAKETVVATIATTYGMDAPDDAGAPPSDLGEQVRASLLQSSGGSPGAAALAFMVFSLVYTPCMVAVSEMRRLFGWRPTLASVGASVVAAWVLAVVVFQVGRAL